MDLFWLDTAALINCEAEGFDLRGPDFLCMEIHVPNLRSHWTRGLQEPDTKPEWDILDVGGEYSPVEYAKMSEASGFTSCQEGHKIFQG